MAYFPLGSWEMWEPCESPPPIFSHSNTPSPTHTVSGDIVSAPLPQPTPTKKRTRKRTSAKPCRQPKHKQDPEDPKWNKQERKSILKAKSCHQYRENNASEITRLKEEIARLSSENARVPELEEENAELKASISKLEELIRVMGKNGGPEENPEANGIMNNDMSDLSWMHSF